jgi:hypothetical protein
MIKSNFETTAGIVSQQTVAWAQNALSTYKLIMLLQLQTRAKITFWSHVASATRSKIV